MSKDFLEWNYSARLKKLNEMAKMIEGEGKRPDYAGAHSGNEEDNKDEMNG